MIAKNISKFAHGATFASTVQLAVPGPPWRRGTKGIGGSETAASGVIEAFLVRRDTLLTLTLRFTEAEYFLLLAMIAASVDAGLPVRWYPDVVTSPAAYYTAYIEEPAVDTEWTPDPDPAYPGLLRAQLRLRIIASSGTPATQYYATPAV